MSYQITAYSRNRAKTLNVTIKRSLSKGKKLDVFKKFKNADGKVVLKKVVN